MNGKYFQAGFKGFGLWLAVAVVFLMPLMVYAGDFYQCRDKNGNESIMDFPIDGQTCNKVEMFEESTGAAKADKAEVSTVSMVTKIKVRRNQVLVPVTLVYDRIETEALLLMDTGAQATVINDNVADRLYIRASKMGKAKGRVVGGGIIDIKVVKMDMIKIGPNEITGKHIGIIEQEDRKATYDGLLGMDILGGLSYRVDLANQEIIWR